MLALKDVLSLHILKEAKVLTGEDILQTQLVASVSVIEIPVENFVRPNEMVLSTGIGCGHDNDLFMQFIQDIMACQPAALAIATGRYISHIPQSVLTYAHQHDIPIIEIPWSLHFADITQTIVEALNNKRQEDLETSEKIQQQFLNLILQGGNLSGIAQFIFEKTGQPTIITNQKETIKGTSQSSDQLIETWQQVSGKTSTLHHDKHHDIVKTPIHSAGSVQGHILSEQQTNMPSPRMLLNHAATAAGLWFLRENAVAETETRLHGDFIWSLAKGDLHDSQDMIHSRARSLGIDLSLNYVCLLGQLEYTDTLSSQDEQDHILRDILQHIQSLAEAQNAHIMMTSRQHMVVVFLEVSLDQVIDTARMFCRSLEEQLHRLPAGSIMSWGIGENEAGNRHFSQSYRAARTALQIGIEQKGVGHITSYGDTRLYRALQQISHHQDIKELTEEVIGKLTTYSHEKHIDLIQTFNGYIQHQRNISKTAKALHLHRQSLLYRLQKIESLTGYSFNNPDDLFLMHLCIKLWSAGLVNDK